MKQTKEEKEAFQGGVVAGVLWMWTLTLVFLILLEVF